MAIIVVGGQASKVGKTAVIEQIIRMLPQLHWTAFKITPHAHGLTGSPFSIRQEHDATAATDSSRFLAAGAVRSFLVRAKDEHLEKSLPSLRNELACSTHAIIESNSIVEFLQPELFLIVLDPAIEDFKHSACRSLGRANAVLWSSNPQQAHEHAGWPPQAATTVQNKLQFVLDKNYGISSKLLHWITERIGSIDPEA